MENVQVYVALAIIGVTIILFATEAFKTSITAILSSLAMVLVGINTPKNLTSGFSNSAMLFCFGIAVVGTALSETGCLSYLCFCGCPSKSNTNILEARISIR